EGTDDSPAPGEEDTQDAEDPADAQDDGDDDSAAAEDAGGISASTWVIIGVLIVAAIILVTVLARGMSSSKREDEPWSPAPRRPAALRSPATHLSGRWYRSASTATGRPIRGTYAPGASSRRRTGPLPLRGSLPTGSGSGGSTTPHSCGGAPRSVPPREDGGNARSGSTPPAASTSRWAGTVRHSCPAPPPRRAGSSPSFRWGGCARAPSRPSSDRSQPSARSTAARMTGSSPSTPARRSMCARPTPAK